jgi:branched-chain amino acid aminotransferase
MGIESDFIWFDGALVPYAEAKVHVLTHTLHYGVGVFEGIRAYEQDDGRAGIWRLREHLDRFLLSARMCRMPTPAWGVDALTEACLDVLDANGFTSAYLRPLAFLGAGAMGLGARTNPIQVVIAAWRWGAYMGEEGLARGVRLKTSSLVRSHPNAALQSAKVVGHYVNNILARYEANDAGFDEALMLDHHGFVAEGTGENIFLVDARGRVVTPPLANVLPGITRRTVIELLEHDGVEVVEQFFGRDALYGAREVFMVGTAAEVTPIRDVDGIAIDAPGPITQRVQSVYLDAVRGRVPWLRPYVTTRS